MTGAAPGLQGGAGLFEVSVTALGLLLFAAPGVILAHRGYARLTGRNPDALWVGGALGLFGGHVLYALGLRLLGPRTWLWAGVLVAAALLGALVPLPRRRGGAPAPESASWGRGDWLLLGAVLAFVLVCVLIPFRRIGERLPEGVVYRNYFSGDYLKHQSMTGALLTGEMPPGNPYMSGFPLHYYWLYYLSPAFSYRLAGGAADLLRIQIAHNLVFIALFLLAFHSVLRRLIPGRGGQALSLLGIAGISSYEGVLVLLELERRGLPWRAFREYNVDGYTRWRWVGLQLDTMYRAFIYTAPQLLSCTLLLVVILLLAGARRGLSAPRALAIGGAIAGCAAYNFFLGAAAGGALVVLAPLLLRRKEGAAARRWSLFWKLLLLAVPLLLAGVFFLAFRMVGPGAASLQVRFLPRVWLLFLPVLLANLGPLLILGAVGFVVLLRRARTEAGADTGEMLAFLVALFVVTCLMILLLHRGDHPAVSVKLGQILALVLALAAGAWPSAARGRARRLRWIAALLLMAAAAPTLGMDVFNAQDVHQRGRRVVFDPEDLAMMDWARRNLPPDSVIQTLPDRDPIEGRARDGVAHIVPCFALRPTMIADRHHSLLYLGDAGAEYERRRQIAYRLFRSLDFQDAMFITETMGIDAIYVGADERRRCPEGSAKFAILPRLHTRGPYFLAAAAPETRPAWRLDRSQLARLQQGEPFALPAPLPDGPELSKLYGTFGTSDTPEGPRPALTLHEARIGSFAFEQLPAQLTLRIEARLEDPAAVDAPRHALCFARTPDGLITVASLALDAARRRGELQVTLPAGTSELHFAGGNLQGGEALLLIFLGPGDS
jgi:hypothetical protein